MKNKKIVLFIFAILAFIGLGIGYAALTDTLTLTGTVNGAGVNGIGNNVSNADAYKLKWVDYRVENKVRNGNVDGLADITAVAEITDDGTQINVTVGNMALQGDKVTLKVVAKNESTYHTSYSPNNGVVKDSNGNTVSIFTTLFNDSMEVDLCAGEQKEFTLMIQLNQTVTTPGTYTFTFALIGTASEETHNS